jgi:hypothetical protein
MAVVVAAIGLLLVVTGAALVSGAAAKNKPSTGLNHCRAEPPRPLHRARWVPDTSGRGLGEALGGEKAGKTWHEP